MQAKKSLGQNFLKCAWALRTIVESAQLTEASTVLEVGPGTGALTEKLLERGGTVIAVEKDDRLVPYLQEKFKTEIEKNKLLLIHGDILEENLRKELPLPSKYSVVANIPYYITGQFMRIMLESEKQPTSMILMLQKEVVDRIIARDGKESILSIATKVYGTPKKVIDVPKHCFAPAPEIDSAVIQISDISKNFFKDINEEVFFKILKAGFGQKRKQLAGNIASCFDRDVTEIKEILGEIGIPINARAENLTPLEWKKLVQKITD